MAVPSARAAKAWLKGRLKQARLAHVRRFRSYGPADLAQALDQVGVRPGDAVMAHSAFDRFEGFRGSASEAIAALQTAVGADGTLLMPTLPFTGSAIEFVRPGVEEGRVFDLKRLPSRMGLLTELFRRSPGVLRSVHPTHPVAARGAAAAAMVAGHHEARTPCGAGSPFARLVEADGKVLLLGTGIRAMTLFHLVEEVLESVMPFSPFLPLEFRLRVRAADGREHETVTRLFDPAVSGRRNLERLVPALKASGAWHRHDLKGLSIICLEARRVLATARELAERGHYCYDP